MFLRFSGFYFAQDRLLPLGVLETSERIILAPRVGSYYNVSCVLSPEKPLKDFGTNIRMHDNHCRPGMMISSTPYGGLRQILRMSIAMPVLSQTIVLFSISKGTSIGWSWPYNMSTVSCISVS